MLRLIISIAALTLCLGVGAQPRITVIAASETWDQLLYLDDKNQPKGVLADFVRRMDDVQDKFHFELRLFPRLRLDQVFIEKGADVYPLRTTEWTRPELGLLPTRTIVNSGDLYFARRDNRLGGRKVFADLSSKTIAGVRGYHYRLFNNNADETYIKDHFKAYLVASNEAVVRLVLAGRADIGIVPEVIMAQYMIDPAMRAQLILSDDYDARVELSNLVRKDGPISVAEMDAIVEALTRAGDVAKLKKYFQAIKR